MGEVTTLEVYTQLHAYLRDPACPRSFEVPMLAVVIAFVEDPERHRFFMLRGAPLRGP